MKTKALNMVIRGMAVVAVLFSFLAPGLTAHASEIANFTINATMPLHSGYNTRGGTLFAGTDNYANGTFGSLGFKIRKVGSPTGDVTFVARTASGGVPTTVISSAVLMDASSLNTTAQWYSVNLPAFTIAGNASWWGGVEYAGGDGSNYVELSWSNGSVSSHYKAYMYNAGWINYDLYDMGFDFYTTTVNFAVSTDGNAYNTITNSQDVQGAIESLASVNATTRGIQYGTSTGVYTTNITETGSYGATGFFETIPNASLTIGNTYVYRAEAYTSAEGWAYGSEHSFVYAPTSGKPTVYSGFASADGTTTATQQSGLNHSGSANVTSLGAQIGTSPGVYTANVTQSVNMAYSSDSFFVFTNQFTGLSAGVTYYWRAEAYSAYGWAYGIELSFKQTTPATVNLIAVTSTPGAGGNSAIFTAEVTGLGSGGNITLEGFNVGTANGTWDLSPSLGGLSQSLVGSTTNGIGLFSLHDGHFTDNQTYYWQAYAYNVDGLIGQVGTSTVGSFVYHAGVYNYGIIRTNVARPGGSVVGGPVDGLNFGVTLVLAPVNIVQYGTTYWYGTTNRTVKKIGVWTVFTFNDLGGMNSDPIPTGTVVNYQAYMIDQNGHISQGDALQVTMGSVQQQLIVVTNGAIASGTTAYMGGTAYNTGFYTIDAIGFTWGTSTTGEGVGAWQIVPDQNNTAGVWHYTAGNLTLGTHYYNKAYVVVGGIPIWGAVNDFVTTTASAVAGAPTIRTDPATGITVNGFIAHGTVVDIGGANIGGVMFDLSTTNQYWQQRFFVPNSVNQTGSFSLLITGLAAGSLVYVRAGGMNVYDYNFGARWPVQLGIGTTPGQNLPPGPGGVSIDGFVNMMAYWMRSWGMDTSMGHWGFMFLLMAIVSIFGVIFIITQKEPVIKKIYGIIVIALIIIIAAAFIFSGLLGIMTIVVVIVVAIATVVLFTVNKYRGSN